MRKYSKRLTKKWLKRVADGLSSGETVPNFYTYRVLMILHWFYDYQYLTVFRPWWYEQNWTEKKLVDEHQRHFVETDQKFKEWSGIDAKLFVELLKLERDGRKKRNRKPRKEKSEPPIRKLRNPRQFEVKMRNGTTEYVTGEIAFRHGEHEYFIYHTGYRWCVSDVEMGAAITYDRRYNEAVRRGKEIIEGNYDKYVEFLKKQLNEVHGRVSES